MQAREITTPPHKTAPLRRRLLAMVYDGLLLLAILFCVGMIYSAIVVFSTKPDPEFLNAREGDVITELEQVDLGWPIYPAEISAYLFFYIYFWKKTGQTLGMRAWKIRVIRATDAINGEKPDAAPSTLQCLQRLFWGTFSLLLLGLGYWVMLFNRDKGTWHDRLSKTRVIQINPSQR